MFAKANRNLSNGCVRVEDARRFGRWLLGHEPVAPGTDAEIQVQLPRGVPIYLTYITAQVRDGKLAYLADPLSAGIRSAATRPRQAAASTAPASSPRLRFEPRDRPAPHRACASKEKPARADARTGLSFCVAAA